LPLSQNSSGMENLEKETGKDVENIRDKKRKKVFH
jgi:hypothetical protein